MSYQAVSWALQQPVKPSPAKFLLVALAHYVPADQQGPLEAYASVSRLVEATCQDRKTVMANLDRLIKMGCLIDTGKRVGQTKSVVVYELRGLDSSPKSGTTDTKSSTESGTPKQSQISHEAVPETAPLRSPRTGTASHLSSTESGTPLDDGSSTGFTYKQSQISHEAVPVFPTEKVLKGKEKVIARGTRISPDWTLTKKLGEWAMEKNPAWTADDVREQAEAFRDHWIAATGSTSRKRDWDAAWRTWVRKAMEFSGRRPGGQTTASPWSTAI